MPNDFFSELKKFFEKLPGIGPRQASRFIWALSDFSENERSRMSELIRSFDAYFEKCEICLRVFNKKALGAKNKICSFCAPDSKRNHSQILIIERDGDLMNIERSGTYTGLYHVLGGAIDPLDSSARARDSIKKLYDRLSKTGSKEIILALSPTKLGEFTSSYIIKVLEPLKLKITRLGRGLSSGTDLEYADETTLKHALDNRK